jgi:thioredoxin reductase (NADPH)
MTDSLTIKGAAIFVRDLEIPARLGVYANERESEQTIRLNVEVGLEEVEEAVSSERLEATRDYATLADIARRVVARGHFELVETLAHAIAESILVELGVTWAKVRIDKLGCLPDADAAGAEIILELDSTPDAPAPIAAKEVRDAEDVVIVGGGAAGYAAALWVWRLGYTALLIDPSPQLGGQLHVVHRPMPDLPGVAPLTGPAFARRLARQFARHDGRWLRDTVTSVSPDDLPRIGLNSGRVVSARTVIIATGIRRRQLEVPGETELLGRGVLVSASPVLDQLAQKRCAVVGGGDSACENALLMAEAGALVALVHYRSRLGARHQFLARIEATPQIDLRLQTRVTRFDGDERLETITIEAPSGSEAIPVDVALVRIGWRPNSETFPKSWLDSKGYVTVDRGGLVGGATRVFAAGDILGPICPSLASAIGSAATAARAACALL